MKIVDFLRRELVFPELTGRDKTAVIRELADHLAAHVSGVDKEVLAKALLEQPSAGTYEGVAIRHCTLNAVRRLMACVGRAPAGVDFDSMDGWPAHLFFVLVAPPESDLLAARARISRLVKDPEIRQRLLQARDSQEIFHVIADGDAGLG